METAKLYFKTPVIFTAKTIEEKVGHGLIGIGSKAQSSANRMCD